MSRRHTESHKSENIGWLRAAVLGANDGIVSTASLIVGVVSANASQHDILVTGAAGLVAGAMSMAAGEYVSVSSHADTENADKAREKAELKANPAYEMEELAQIYVERGLDRKIAREVAMQLMAQDALGAHLRDELGITPFQKARPMQAASASAITFAIGASLPLLLVYLAPFHQLILWESVASMIFLMTLGMLAAWAGGASMLVGALRVGLWGALAMAVTAGIGRLFGAVV